MKNGMMIASLAGLAAAGTASATFVSYVVTVTQVTTGGVLLDQYQVKARFNGATDTVLNVFNFSYSGGASAADAYGAFYHKDNSSYNGGVLSKQYGTWSPTLTGSPTLNRPFDSYLTIGGLPTATNTSNADPSWNSAGASGWSRPDIPSGFNIGWFNSSPPNLQGRVGVAPNTATDVLLGQFVIDRGGNAGSWTITAGYNDGVAGSAVQFYSGSFALGVPAPGAVALLGLAGLAGRRRR